MRGYGVARRGEEMGWKTARLCDLADVQLGKMLDRTKHRSGKRLPYLRNVNVRWGRVDVDDLLEMYFEDTQLERYGLKAGDVLVCEGGEPGRAAVWDGRLASLKYQKALHRVRFRVPYEPRLFVYLLEHYAKSGTLERSFTGSTIKHLTREAFAKVLVPTPPLPEQQRIVEEIEKQLTRLEAGVAALRRAQANLKRYRGAVLNAACEGRLVPTEAELARREGREYVTGQELLAYVLNDRRRTWEHSAAKQAKYKPPTPHDALPPRSLPQGWTWTTLDMIAQEGRPIIYGIIKPGPHVPDGVPYVRVTEMKDGRIDVATLRRAAPARAAKFARATLAAGDLVISKDGTIGRVAVVPTELEGGNITQHVMRVPVHSAVCRDYVVWAVRSDELQRWLKGETKGVALQGVNVEDFRRLPIPLPPLAEQHRIVAEVERRLSVVEELEATVAANLARAARLRQAILQRAFSGELVPPEPAAAD